ncbi:hypothetical protein Pla144_09930 [Bythopirellula polymerisocia]|uniref:Uncharacterized protein n=1 Tax=Bythopirellula polymerisocia TaxID=2528003 RepID=A0A5C6D3H0_9BACT|nr:hypothetical protein Pla144_09930 [Bythopirellula polymerisocia]
MSFEAREACRMGACTHLLLTTNLWVRAPILQIWKGIKIQSNTIADGTAVETAESGTVQEFDRHLRLLSRLNIPCTNGLPSD